MTTIVGVRKHGEIYLASDSLGTSNNLQTDHGPKFVRGANFIFAYSYSYRVAQIIQHALQCGTFETPLHWSMFEIIRFSGWLQKLLQDNGAKKEGDKHEMPLHPVSLILSSKEMLFQIDSDYACFEIKEFVAAGSGREFAYGALDVLYCSKLSARKIAEAAVNTACRFDKNTGGKVYLVKL